MNTWLIGGKTSSALHVILHPLLGPHRLVPRETSSCSAFSCLLMNTGMHEILGKKEGFIMPHWKKRDAMQ